MVLRRTASGWLAQAPAKVNLHLRVLGRRPDGWHEVDSVIAPIGVCDSLEVEVDRDSNALNLSVVDSRGRPVPGVPCDRTNLVIRALQLLRERYSVATGAKVRLVKRIPAEAGLGGGSSDAAAALVLGCRMWGIETDGAVLHSLATELGSDVPVFLSGGPALCTGRGERVAPIALPSIPCVVARPPIGLATADVYRTCQPDRGTPGAGRLLESLRTGDLATAGATLFNGLQAAAQSISRSIEETLSAFRALGLPTAAMTGSGTACFALAPNNLTARRAAAALASRGIGWVCPTRTLSHSRL